MIFQNQHPPSLLFQPFVIDGSDGILYNMCPIPAAGDFGTGNVPKHGEPYSWLLNISNTCVGELAQKST